MTSVVLAMTFGGAQALAGETVTATYDHRGPVFTLATGSPGELGLLEGLAAAFARETPATMRWVKAGSGASLKLLREGKVDVVMVHAPRAEAQAVDEGWATQHTLIGSNEFYIVGPKDDPAEIAAAESAADAFARIATVEAPFVTRADNSGTHKKEMGIWKSAGAEPGGGWYVPTNDFMTASLRKANEIDGYFMVDSSTWVAEKHSVPNLAVLFRGDPVLVNTYHALVSSAQTPGRDAAGRFVDFIASDDGQRVIREYGAERFGDSLYQDASYAQKYVH